MNAFVITSVCLAALGLICRLIWLGKGSYPRCTDGVTSGTDAFMCVVSTLWIGWGLWLLTR